jgi:hypothetical protein
MEFLLEDKSVISAEKLSVGAWSLNHKKDHQHLSFFNIYLKIKILNHNFLFWRKAEQK